ncbi:Glutamate NMDA receptor subunit 1 [Porphyridium purpureum]|uniref:Glutamate NMDA receptor subunit 1 n=1 Tax=Porphyridium purpureum TaxID=35688 RepID=A0A5J4YX40_PORPP|nr:Glutamate NMDA receptor subunit 1 [Porphyridium purpureum]|eukprot:POR6505..scf209_3
MDVRFAPHRRWRLPSAWLVVLFAIVAQLIPACIASTDGAARRQSSSEQPTYNVLILFSEQEAREGEGLVQFAVAQANQVLEKRNAGFSVETIALVVDERSAFEKVCRGILTSREKGLIGIVGPSDAHVARLLQASYAIFPVPVISTSSSGASSVSRSSNTWRIFASEDAQAAVLAQLILFNGQDRARKLGLIAQPSVRVAVLHEKISDGDNMMLAFSRAAQSTRRNGSTLQIVTSHAISDEPSRIGDAFESIQKNDCRLLVVFVSSQNVLDILLHYMLDSSLFSFEYQLYFGSSALEALASSTFSSDDRLATVLAGSLGVFEVSNSEAQEDDIPANVAAVNPLWAHRARKFVDAILSLAHAFANVSDSGVDVFGYAADGCFSNARWAPGDAVQVALAGVDFAGFSGRVLFDTVENVSASGVLRWQRSRSLDHSQYKVFNLQAGSDDSIPELVGIQTWNTEEPETFKQVQGTSQAYPGNADEVPGDRTSLRGSHLKGFVRNAPPFVFLDDSGSRVEKGIAIDLMEWLSEHAGFTYELSVAPVTPFDDLVPFLENGTVDFVIDWVTMYSSRLNKVDFTTSYFDLGLIVVTRTIPPPPAIDALNFLSPFSWSLWLLIGAFTILAALLFTLFESGRNRDFAAYYRSQSFGKALYTSIALLMAQLAHKPVTGEGFVLSIAWLIFTFIVAAAYTARLTSFLTLQKQISTFNGIQDLQRSRGVTIAEAAVLVDSSISLYVDQNILDCDDVCLPEQRLYTPCFSIQECFDLVLDGTVRATIMDSPIADLYITSECTELAARGSLFALQNYGIALRKDAPFRRDLDSAILVARSENVVEASRNRILGSSVSICSLDDSSDRMEFNQLSGLFLVTAGFISISLLLFLLRLAGFKKKWMDWYAQTRIAKIDRKIADKYIRSQSVDDLRTYLNSKPPTEEVSQSCDTALGEFDLCAQQDGGTAEISGAPHAPDHTTASELAHGRPVVTL